MRLLRAILLSVGLLALAAPAWGHAAYRASDPADESTVSAPPSEVWAEFTEPVTLESRLSVFDPCGAQVDHGDSSVSGYRITVSMSGQRAGTYTVAFDVISAVDGHPNRGSFTFTSTGGEPCPGSEAEAEEPANEGAAEQEPGESNEPMPEADADRSDGEGRKTPGKQSARRGDRKGVAGGPSVSEDPESEDDGLPAPPVLAQNGAEANGEMPVGGVAVALGIAAGIGIAAALVYIRLVRPPRP